jgi:hypothetical protein
MLESDSEDFSDCEDPLAVGNSSPSASAPLSPSSHTAPQTHLRGTQSVLEEILNPFGGKRVADDASFEFTMTRESQDYTPILIILARNMDTLAASDVSYVFDTAYAAVKKFGGDRTPYEIVYIHRKNTGCSSIPVPVLKKKHDEVPKTIRKNLRNVYIIHPSPSLKMSITLFQTFASAKFAKKIHILSTLGDLYRRIPPSVLQLPREITRDDVEYVEDM